MSQPLAVLASAAPVASNGAIRRAFSRGVADNALAELVIQTLRVGGRILLARRLRPGDFGTFKVLSVFVGIGGLLNEAGLPEALIQRQKLTSRHEATVWWLTLGLAAMISGGLYGMAPVIANAMAMPGLSGALRLLCLPLLLAGTAITVSARLRRQLRFGVLGIADALSELGFLLAALLMVVFGSPRVSLAFGLAARLASNALVLWLAAP